MTDFEAAISASQVAELAGVTQSAVSNWRKRFSDFPKSVGTSPAGGDLFELSEVEEWLANHDRLTADGAAKRVLFGATSILRDQLPNDRVVEVLCAALALVAIGEASVDGSLKTVREPEDSDLYEPLASIESKLRAQLFSMLADVDRGVLPEVFEAALERHDRFRGTRTDGSLTSLLMRLAADRAAGVVYDPAAGEAGFLIAAARQLNAEDLVGQEVNPASWRIARQRLLVHGIAATVFLGDSLLEDRVPEVRAATIFCDPPYGTKLSPLDAVRAQGPTAMRAPSGDYAWLRYVLERLDDGGRAHVLLPEGTLFRGGREADWRRELLIDGSVEAVISLPGRRGHNTALPLALWVLRKDEPAETGVLLVDATQIEAAGGDVDETTSKILRAWRSGQHVPPEFRQFAAAPERRTLISGDVNLTPARWLSPTAGRERSAAESQLRDRVVDLKSSLAHTTALSATRLSDFTPPPPYPWISVRQMVEDGLAEVLRGPRIRPEDCTGGHGDAPVVRARDLTAHDIQKQQLDRIAPDLVRPRPQLTQPGDVIVSPASGHLKAVVDTEGGHLVASPLSILRFQAGIVEPEVAAACLASSRNRRFVKGTAYARIDVRELEMPLFPLDDSQRVASALHAAREIYQHGAELAAAGGAAFEAIVEVLSHEEEA